MTVSLDYTNALLSPSESGMLNAQNMLSEDFEFGQSLPGGVDP
jgi:hypothetical protein